MYNLSIYLYIYIYISYLPGFYHQVSPCCHFPLRPQDFPSATSPRIVTFASSHLSTNLTPNIYRAKTKVEVTYIQIFSKLQTKPTNY